MKNKQPTPASTDTIIFGVHPLVELLTAKRRPVRVVYTTKPEPKAWSLIQKKLPAHVPVQYVTRDRLHQLAQTTDHQGIVAVVGQFPLRKKPFNPEREKFLVLLDGVQDPRNLGAILRSAYCTGVHGVILCKKGGVALTGAAIKASAGLAEHMEIYEAPTALHATQELTQQGYHVYMAALGGQDARTVNYLDPLCLVIGSEDVGISPQVRALGTTIMLAQKTPEISYNASVAAGILLFLIGSAHKKI